MEFDARSHVHASATQGEQLAARRAGTRARAMWRSILRELEASGEVGMTPDEYAERHCALINTVRRRFTDLWKEGKIRHHPGQVHRENAAGNPCIVWVMGRDPAAAPRRGRPTPRPEPLSEQRILQLTNGLLLSPIEAVSLVRQVEYELGVCRT